MATVPACSSGTLTNVEFYAADTGHDTPPRHSIQLRGRPVVVLFIDVEHHTGIYNCPFECLGSDPIGKFFTNLPHTPANAHIYDAGTVVVTVRRSVESIPYPR